MAKRGLEESQEENFYQTNMQIREHPYVLQKELFLEADKNQLININSEIIDFGFNEVLTMSGQK